MNNLIYQKKIDSFIIFQKLLQFQETMKKQSKLLMWLQKVLSVWPLDQLVYYVDLEPQHARQGWPWQHPISTMLLRVKYGALKCKY